MNILVVGAHADDIELACGGTISRAIKSGHKVLCLYTTKSEFTDKNGKVERTRETVEEELKVAMKLLGVGNNYIELDFSTKDVPYNSELISQIDKVIESFNPDIIFTHWIFDTHQAHRNTSQATISAARNKQTILMFEPFPPSGRSYMPFNPKVYIDISDNIKDKIKAIKAHKSQVKKYGKDWFESIEGRARIRGYENKCKYAETFEPVRIKLEL
jgi:LmbE family N-acetylglucosaminyl deacetylase